MPTSWSHKQMGIQSMNLLKSFCYPLLGTRILLRYFRDLHVNFNNFFFENLVRLEIKLVQKKMLPPPLLYFVLQSE